jgi:putative phage-type endonuclease
METQIENEIVKAEQPIKLNVKSFQPASKEEWLKLRSSNLNSTEISALYGFSPYTSIFELWHRIKGNITVDFDENDRVKWGTRLESAIAQGIAEDNNFIVLPMKQYICDPDLRIGSSFDFSIEAIQLDTADGVTGLPDLNLEKGILEIKNVDSLIFKGKWLEDENGNLEAPLHIEIQVQVQMLVSGRKYAYIGAFVGGNNVQLIKREADLEIQASILNEVEKFWKSIDANIAPSPDFEADIETIRKLNPFAKPGKVLDATGNAELYSFAQQYLAVNKQIKDFEKEKESIKGQILMTCGDAEKVIGENYSITMGVIGPTLIESYERKGYRNFRVNGKKEK